MVYNVCTCALEVKNEVYIYVCMINGYCSMLCICDIGKYDNWNVCMSERVYDMCKGTLIIYVSDDMSWLWWARCIWLILYYAWS